MISRGKPPLSKSWRAFGRASNLRQVLRWACLPRRGNRARRRQVRGEGTHRFGWAAGMREMNLEFLGATD